MILGVNGIRLVANRSGVARAIEAILQGMAELPHPFTEIRLYTPRPLDAHVAIPPNVTVVVRPSALPPAGWEQITLPRAHGSRAPLFCPSYVVPLLARCPMLLAHHGSYEGYADRAQVFSWWARTKARVSYQLSAHRADVVCTVSEYSRRDMAHFYRMSPDRIHVVPEGVDTRLFRPLDDQTALADWRRRILGEDVPFVLYVGKPTKRRNLPNLLEAFARLRRDHRLPHKLLLIGTALPGTSFEKIISSLDLNGAVVTVPHAPHTEIALAYNACSTMIYPSSYEGFGMPVLEAMACGAPVIALNNTAIPEFAGGVASLLPDASVDTLARGIEDLLADDARRTQMRIDGPIRAARYDWRIVTRQYLDLLIPLATR
ncbi:MAG: glycosyltransferase family 1 protein [Acidobacteriota bacterium]